MMIIFSIIISALVTAAIVFGAVAFVMRENRLLLKEIVEKLSETYLAKYEKDLEEKRPTDERAPDPEEIMELTPEEEFVFKHKPKEPKPNEDAGA